MSTFLAQVIYGGMSGAKPVEIDIGEDDKVMVPNFDTLRDMSEAQQESLGQIITQYNADSQRVSNLITDQGLLELDTGTATTGQLATECNKLRTILTQLVLQGKNRG